MKHRTRKYRKNLKKRTRKIRRFRRKRIGGHDNEGIPHWHLRIKMPRGQTLLMPEAFERTQQGRDSMVVSGTVRDIQMFVEDQGLTPGTFTLYWKGKKLANPDIKIRHIMVDGQKIPLYDNSAGDPINVVLNSELPPEFVEGHDLDLVDYNAPQTPR
jgi:hypothetical protein